MKQRNFAVRREEYDPGAYGSRRWPSPRSDVQVPLLQALVTALVISVAVTGVVWGVFGLDFWKTLGVAFCAALVVSWFWRLGIVTETLWEVEERLGVDVTGDGKVGRPTQPSVRVEIASGNREQYVDIEGLSDLTQIRQLAILGLTNRFNERAVARAFGWPREQWQEIRDQLIERGLVEWNGEEGSTRGVSLTPDGEAVMRAVLEETAGPK